MSDSKTSSSNKQTASGRNAPKSKKVKPSGGRGQGGGDQIPHYLKLSPKYLTWKACASQLAKDLEKYSMSISELGKAIAEYSAKGCQFEIDIPLVEAYSHYESLKTGWEHFRDSFRAQDDAAGVPVGVAAKLLAAGANLEPPKPE